jgi:hypothetical protein
MNRHLIRRLSSLILNVFKPRRQGETQSLLYQISVNTPCHFIPVVHNLQISYTLLFISPGYLSQHNTKYTGKQVMYKPGKTFD